jgi:hypothetical protein
MSVWQHAALGAALVVTGWLVARVAAGARFAKPPALLIDGLVPVAGFAVLSAATARPLTAGVAWFLVMVAYALADRAKRAALREPILYTDAFQTIDVLIRHPTINVLFKRGPCVTGAMFGVGLIMTALLLEPPDWPWSIWLGVAAIGVGAAFSWMLHRACLAGSCSVLRGLRPTGDPVADTARLGPFAIHLVYAAIARAERASRQAAAAPKHILVRRAGTVCAARPLVVVQCESFFDPRRLHPAIPRDLLPSFDACRRDGVQWGRLAVPGVGANTVRTEFAVLTGLPEEALGFDRFNPYLFFARAPIRSLAWRLRAEGYRTICVHPFDRRFYRRDLVMSNFGFDAFLGEEAFVGAARAGGYVSDDAVADVISDLLHEEGSGVFVFAITMENHGPWPASCGGASTNLARGSREPGERSVLRGFLRGIASADAMLGRLTDLLRDGSGTLAFYGDHLPNLPAAFAQLGFRDARTDYAIWRPGGRKAAHQDLAAWQLSQAIWDAWRVSADTSPDPLRWTSDAAAG